MLERMREESTPSVYFNFDYSNQKTNQISLDKEYIPFQYTCTDKAQQSFNKQNEISDNTQFQFATPPSYIRKQICKNLYDGSHKNQKSGNQGHNQAKDFQIKLKNVSVKLDTEQFFDQFDKNFVVNFGDTPAKNDFLGADFRKTFESCPGVTNKQTGHSKVESRISQPIARSKRSLQPQNEEEIQLQSPILLAKQSKEQKDEDPQAQKEAEKQNKPPNGSIRSSKLINCQIRKRILLKNNEKIAAQFQRRKQKPSNNIINQGNLLIVTSNNWQRWTDKPNEKKNIQANSQPIKRVDKTLKKAESNIFTTRQMFKDTLRSTTLDSWKKKFTIHKNQMDLKHKNRTNNIFQKPFSYIR